MFNDLITDGETNILEIYEYGGGRIVYDISHLTDNPMVLKVAFNNYGIDEINQEIKQRKNMPEPFKSRLVPILKSNKGWCIQPKCDKPKDDTYKYLQKLFSDIDMNDKSEIYKQNVGFWNNYPVILDYGGIGFKI